MLSGSQIVELWNFFKEYIDRKQPMDLIAEKFVDLLAIQYFLDIDEEQEDY